MYYTIKISTWWRHQMEMFSVLLAICAGNSSVTGEFPAQRPVTRSCDVSLICAWINGWVNNGEVGDLRRSRTHNDVTVISCIYCIEYSLSEMCRMIGKRGVPLLLPGESDWIDNALCKTIFLASERCGSNLTSAYFKLMITWATPVKFS